MFEAAICPLLGVLLGMRFRVAILLPATFLVASVMLWTGLIQGQNVTAQLISQTTGVVALQLGYLVGVLLLAPRELALLRRP